MVASGCATGVDKCDCKINATSVVALDRQHDTPPATHNHNHAHTRPQMPPTHPSPTHLSYGHKRFGVPLSCLPFLIHGPTARSFSRVASSISAVLNGMRETCRHMSCQNGHLRSQRLCALTRSRKYNIRTHASTQARTHARTHARTPVRTPVRTRKPYPLSCTKHSTAKQRCKLLRCAKATNLSRTHARTHAPFGEKQTAATVDDASALTGRRTVRVRAYVPSAVNDVQRFRLCV